MEQDKRGFLGRFKERDSKSIGEVVREFARSRDTRFDRE
jgi:hypothetical protein